MKFVIIFRFPLFRGQFREICDLWCKFDVNNFDEKEEKCVLASINYEEKIHHV